MVNSALKQFYMTYEPYFGESFQGMIDRLIIPHRSGQSLLECTDFVQYKLRKAMESGKKHPLAGVKGVGVDYSFWPIANVFRFMYWLTSMTPSQTIILLPATIELLPPAMEHTQRKTLKIFIAFLRRALSLASSSSPESRQLSYHTWRVVSILNAMSHSVVSFLGSVALRGRICRLLSGCYLLRKLRKTTTRSLKHMSNF